MTITFRPLEPADCDLVAAWRAAPHVTPWFGPSEAHDAEVAAYRAYVDGTSGKQGHLVLENGEPVAFVESYVLRDRPQYFANLKVSDPGAAGLDLFIGPLDALGRGLGEPIVRGFLAEVLFVRPEVTACYVAPDVRNRRSIEVFERAGFVRHEDVQVPGDDAPAAVLRIERPT